MAHEMWIEAADTRARRRGPARSDITDMHVTHNPRGDLEKERRERTRAARAVVRFAVRSGIPEEIAELMECVGVTHQDAMPDRVAAPMTSPRRRVTRRPRVAVAEKRCSRCGQVKPAKEFYREPRNIDELMSRCKSCHQELNSDAQRRRNAARRAERAAKKENA